jgi:hypothetical protein
MFDVGNTMEHVSWEVNRTSQMRYRHEAISRTDSAFKFCFGGVKGRCDTGLIPCTVHPMIAMHTSPHK